MLRSIISISFQVRNCQWTFGKQIVRDASRFKSRQPVAIVNEEDLYEKEEIPADIPLKRPRLRRQKSSSTIVKEVKANENLRFQILRADDHRITSLMLSVKSKKAREKNNSVLLEGKRLIRDGLDVGAKPKTILFSRVSDIESLPIPEETELYKVPYRSIQLWSNLTTSPGIIGIFEPPDVQNLKPADDSLPLTIICDNVREPGNLGGILRTAAGVGCEKLILMKGCVDLWEPKVLRSASGAQFRVPVVTSQHWQDVPTLLSPNSRIILADSTQVESSNPDVVSAAGQVMDHDSPQNTYDDNSSLNDENAVSNLNERLVVKEFLKNFPLLPYYSLEYTESEVVLVITGETEGLSPDSCEFLHARNCVRVSIPLTNGLDSLNNGVAFGVIAFEIRRQFARKIDQ